jgi:hypothetical protein
MFCGPGCARKYHGIVWSPVVEPVVVPVEPVSPAVELIRPPKPLDVPQGKASYAKVQKVQRKVRRKGVR